MRRCGGVLSRRIRVLAVAVLGLALLPAPLETVSAASPAGPYVALGDSYAAGPLIPNQLDLSCVRSDHNYPALVAASLQVTAFRDVSCSGATTFDLTQAQLGFLLARVAPQLGALGPDTRLVTLSISGNDIGFADIVVTCAVASLLNPFGAPCQGIYTAGGTDRLAAEVAAAGPRVAAVLQGIHQRAPRALVLVVGYPDILPTAGSGCWPFLPVAAGDLPYLNGIELALNGMLAREASLNRARYVDTYAPSIGHDACQAQGTRWVEGLIPTMPALPIHPNVLGMQATAAAVLAAIRRGH
jgi:lysophospholipase L1-like esterase